MLADKKFIEQSLQAGFNGGWAAANLGLASLMEEAGDSEFAAWLRERAKTPDQVRIFEMTNPKAKG